MYMWLCMEVTLVVFNTITYMVYLGVYGSTGGLVSSAETNSNFYYSNIWSPKRTNID